MPPGDYQFDPFDFGLSVDAMPTVDPFMGSLSNVVDSPVDFGTKDPFLRSAIQRREALSSLLNAQQDKYDKRVSAAEQAQAGQGLTPGQGIASLLIAALPALIGGATSKTKAGKAAASSAGGEGVKTYLDLNERQQKADLQRLLGLSQQDARMLQRTQQDLTDVDKQIQTRQNAKEQRDFQGQQREADRDLRQALADMNRTQLSAFQAGILAMQGANIEERKRTSDRLESGKVDTFVTDTLGPVEAMGGFVRKNPSGALPRIPQSSIKDVQRVKDASDKANELANILRPLYSKEGLTLNLATEDGRITYNQMRTDLQALFEEVAANSVYSKQGLRPDEIGRLLRRMPADPDEFGSFFRNPAITFTKAEIATLDKLVEQLNRTTKTEAKNRGIIFPNADGTIDGEVVTPEDVFDYFRSSYREKKVADIKGATPEETASKAQAENEKTFKAVTGSELPKATTQTYRVRRNGQVVEVPFDELTDQEKPLVAKALGQ